MKGTEIRLLFARVLTEEEIREFIGQFGGEATSPTQFSYEYLTKNIKQCPECQIPVDINADDCVEDCGYSYAEEEAESENQG